MMKSLRTLGIAFIAFTLHTRPLLAQDGANVTGCFIASPALTYSRSGEPERGDTAWSVVQFAAAGKARRPLLRAMLDRRSSYSFEADTLVAFFFDGLAGWRLRLTRSTDGWSGTAQYLSDAIVRGQAPYRRAITLRSTKCAANLPAAGAPTR